MKAPRFFYGWFVAVACFFFTVIGVGLGNGTLSLYVKPICDDLGFSRGSYTLVYSIVACFQMIASLAFGKILRKLGNVRRIFMIGVCGMAAGFTIYHLAKNIYVFYLGAVFMGFGIQYISTIPLSVTISNWFLEKRATMLSLVFAGSGIGGIILNPIIGRWIAVNGWRTSYFYSLLLLLAFLFPALLILRGHPSDVGQTALGTGGQNQRLMPEEKSLSGPTLGEARQTPIFWMVLLAVFFFGVSIQTVYVNASAHLGGIGLDPQVIAYIMSVVFISNTISKVLLGMLNDKYGIKPVVLINNSFFAVATVILILTRGNASGFTFAAGFGIGYTMISITTPMLIATLFGGGDYGNIIGIMIAAQTLGYSIGTPLAGFSFDIFHTYAYAFISAVILDLAGMALVVKALRVREKLWAD